MTIFKCLLLIVAIVLISLQSNAGESRLPVKGTMRHMGMAYGVLQKALIRNERISVETVMNAATHLVTSIAEAKQKAPSKFLSWGGEVQDENEEQLAAYDQQMATLLETAQRLQQALAQGNNALAAQIMKTELAPIMEQGHEQFK